MSRVSIVLLILGGVAPAAWLCGCAQPAGPVCLRPEQASVGVPAPVGPLSFDVALQRMVQHNPELRALRAHAEAVNLRPNEASLRVAGELVDGELGEAVIGTDLMSLLGVGARPALGALQRALRSEAVLRHHERARELVHQLATAYAREAALVGLAGEVERLDVRPYVTSGQAAPADESEADAARSGWHAELAQLEAERRGQRLAIARLLGSAPTAHIDPVTPAPGWPVVPSAGQSALLFARADLQRRAASVEVADRDYRLAVARQLPTVGLALGARFDPTKPLQMLDVSLPLGASSAARAAERSRAAAGLELEAAVLAAQHEAAQAASVLAAREADTAFRARALQAKRASARAARQRTAADVRELTFAVQLESMELEAARDLRLARLEEAQARVDAAVAAGWPGPGFVAAPADACARSVPRGGSK